MSTTKVKILKQIIPEIKPTIDINVSIKVDNPNDVLNYGNDLRMVAQEILSSGVDNLSSVNMPSISMLLSEISYIIDRENIKENE